MPRLTEYLTFRLINKISQAVMNKISAHFTKILISPYQYLNKILKKIEKFLTNIEINTCYFQKITRSLIIFFEDLVYFLNY